MKKTNVKMDQMTQDSLNFPTPPYSGYWTKRVRPFLMAHYFQCRNHWEWMLFDQN